MRLLDARRCGVTGAEHGAEFEVEPVARPPGELVGRGLEHFNASHYNWDAEHDTWAPRPPSPHGYARWLLT